MSAPGSWHPPPPRVRSWHTTALSRQGRPPAHASSASGTPATSNRCCPALLPCCRSSRCQCMIITHAPAHRHHHCSRARRASSDAPSRTYPAASGVCPAHTPARRSPRCRPPCGAAGGRPTGCTPATCTTVARKRKRKRKCGVARARARCWRARARARVFFRERTRCAARPARRACRTSCCAPSPRRASTTSPRFVRNRSPGGAATPRTARRGPAHPVHRRGRVLGCGLCRGGARHVAAHGKGGRQREGAKGPRVCFLDTEVI